MAGPNSGIVIGNRPAPLRVVLTTGSDFYRVLRYADGWPAGATLSLVLPTTTWTASISGTDATFNVARAVADMIEDGTAAQLIYTADGRRSVWADGKVERTDG